MPTIFDFHCPTCNRKIVRVSSDFIGKRAKCKGCGAQLTVPDPALMKVGIDPRDVEIDYQEKPKFDPGVVLDPLSADEKSCEPAQDVEATNEKTQKPAEPPSNSKYYHAVGCPVVLPTPDRPLSSLAAIWCAVFLAINFIGQAIVFVYVASGQARIDYQNEMRNQDSYRRTLDSILRR